MYQEQTEWSRTGLVLSSLVCRGRLCPVSPDVVRRFSSFVCGCIQGRLLKHLYSWVTSLQRLLISWGMKTWPYPAWLWHAFCPLSLAIYCPQCLPPHPSPQPHALCLMAWMLILMLTKPLSTGSFASAWTSSLFSAFLSALKCHSCSAGLYSTLVRSLGDYRLLASHVFPLRTCLSCVHLIFDDNAWERREGLGTGILASQAFQLSLRLILAS